MDDDIDGFEQAGATTSSIVDRFCEAFLNPPKNWGSELHPRASRAKNEEMTQVPPEVRSRLLQEIDALIFLCESPIEQTAIYQLAGKLFSSPRDTPRYCSVLREIPDEWPFGIGVIIVPQVNIGPFRIDFCAQLHSGRRFAIECDGKDFHDAEKDEKRDRYLQENHDVETYRISGRQIFHGDVWAEAVAYVIGSKAI